MDAFNTVWNALQHVQIKYASGTAEAAQHMARSGQVSTRELLRQLNERIDKLVLICRASFELLQEASGVTDQQLAERITEIDLRDGRADGKMTPQQTRCPKCGAGICAKFNRCLFCGYEDTSGGTFHTV